VKKWQKQPLKWNQLTVFTKHNSKVQARQAEINQESIENATKLKEQMESLASNLSSLNGVYGGMLSAMNKN